MTNTKPEWEESRVCHCGRSFVPNKFNRRQVHCSRPCMDAARYYRNHEKRKAKDAELHKRTYTTERGREEARRKLEVEPEKVRARQALRNAVTRGKVVKHPCQECGEVKVDGHHKDYSKPLEVMWLCVPHHHELHRSKYPHLLAAKKVTD